MRGMIEGTHYPFSVAGAPPVGCGCRRGWPLGSGLRAVKRGKKCPSTRDGLDRPMVLTNDE